VPPPPLLLDAVCIFHRPFKLCGLVHWFWYVPTPYQQIVLVSKKKKKVCVTARTVALCRSRRPSSTAL
jgi:hypothetical protein